MADVEAVIEKLEAEIDREVCDNTRFSQAESLEAYRELAGHCAEWAQNIRHDMTQADDDEVDDEIEDE